MSRKIHVKTDAYRVIDEALAAAIEGGMNRCDKWCEETLTDAQRSVLPSQITNRFWTALEEAGVELV